MRRYVIYLGRIGFKIMIFWLGNSHVTCFRTIIQTSQEIRFPYSSLDLETKKSFSLFEKTQVIITCFVYLVYKTE